MDVTGFILTTALAALGAIGLVLLAYSIFKTADQQKSACGCVDKVKRRKIPTLKYGNRLARKRLNLKKELTPKKQKDQDRSQETATYVNVQCNTVQVPGIDKSAHFRYSNSIHQETHDHSMQVIQKDAEIFIPTEAYHEAEQCLRTYNHVTIIGMAGTGKTALAFALLREHAKNGYQVKLVKEPRDLERRDSKKKTIFLINDIFGKSVFLPPKFHEWATALEELATLVGYGTNVTSKIKVISTSRDYIWYEVKNFIGEYSVTLFTENTVINLTGKLSIKEKMSIFESHRVNSGEVADDNLKRQICQVQSPFGFPQACCLYFKLHQYKEKGLSFFQRPLPCLIQCVETLEASDPKKYALLVLVLLHGGEMAKDSMNSEYFSEKFPGNNLGVTRNFNSVASSLQNTFLKTKGRVLTFAHQSIHDTVAYVFGKNNQDFVIQNCSVEFLYERVRIKSKHNDSSIEDRHGFYIKLLPQMWVSLFKRFAKEIAEHNLPLICAHQAMCNKMFVQNCFDLLDDLQDVSKLVDDVFKRSILSWSTWNTSPVLCQFLLSKFRFDEEIILKSIVCCCTSGNGKCLKALIDKVSKKKLFDFRTHDPYEYVVSDKQGQFITKVVRPGYRDSLILLACQIGHKSVKDTLVDTGFSILDINDLGDGALHKCCMSDKHQLIKELLEDGCDPLLQNKYGNIPLHTASKNNNILHAKYLLQTYIQTGDIESQLSKVNNNGETPLLMACKYGNEDFVRWLLNNQVSLTDKDLQGQTVLHLTIREGHTKLASFLLSGIKEMSEGLSQTQLREICLCVDAQDNTGNTPLMLCCREGFYDLAEDLLSYGIDLNTSNNEDLTALLLACENNQVEVAQLLIQAGADVSKANRSGMTSLMFACKVDSSKLVLRLMSNSSDVFARCHNNVTVLMYAVKHSHITTMKKVLSVTVDINAQDSHGCTALYYAVEIGDFEKTKKLLKRHPEINLPNVEGTTPLMVACQKGQSRIIDLLVSHGANLNAENVHGETPLMFAIKGESRHIVQRLLTKGANLNTGQKEESLLFIAVKSDMFSLVQNMFSGNENQITRQKCLHLLCKRGLADGVRKLTELPLDVDYRDLQGNTALILVCREGFDDIASILLDANADANAVDHQSESPLMHACKGGHEGIVRMLISIKDINVNLKNFLKKTPLMMASEKGYPSIIEMLLSANVLLNACDKDGNTALMLASAKGEKDAVNLLLEDKADINCINKYGNTALMLGAKHTSVLSVLIRQKAKCDIVNKDGDTALTLCCKEGLLDGVKQLLKTDVNYETENNERDSAFLIAVKNNYTEIAETLIQHGVSVNAVDKSGESALIATCRNGHTELLRQLINSGANLNAISSDGRSALELARTLPDTQCLILLVRALGTSNKECCELLLLCCRDGSADKVADLFPLLGEDSIVDHHGNTPLISASQEGHITVVKYLLKCKVDVNVQNNDGDSALLLACQNSHPSVVDILLSYSSDVTQRNRKGETPLYWAHLSKCCDIWSLVVMHCNKDSNNKLAWQDMMIRLCENNEETYLTDLLSRGMDANIQDENGDSLLVIASRNGKLTTVKLLLQKGANVECGKEGKTALFYACMKGHNSIVKHLLAHVSDISSFQLDSDVLITACLGNHKNIISQLLDYDPHHKHWAKALLHACESGYKEVVQTILEKVRTFLDFQGFQETPLTIAAAQGFTEILIILGHEFDVNQRNLNGESPLLVACKYGQVDSVTLLLEHGADVMTQDGLGNTPLITACQRSERILLETLLTFSKENNIDLQQMVNQKNSEGKTALHIAAQVGEENFIFHLITQTVDIDLQDVNGESALIVACFNANIPIVQELLSSGASVNISSKTGQTALIVSSMVGCVTIAELLLESKAQPNHVCHEGLSAMHWACKTGNLSMFRLLLGYQKGLDVEDGMGMTPLMYACASGNKQIFSSLIEEGADISYKDHAGHGVTWWTIQGGNLAIWKMLGPQSRCDNLTDLFVFACKCGSLDIAEEMLTNGIDPNTASSQGVTAMTTAAENGNVEIVRLLIAKNASINMTNNNGFTPLMMACVGNSTSIVKLLLQNNANVNASTIKGTTPLIIAARRSSIDIVLNLLTHGANCNVCDTYGESALFKACRRHDIHIVQALLSHEADIYVKNNKDETLFTVSLGSAIKNLLRKQTYISNLFTACENGNFHLMKNILKSGSSGSVHTEVRNCEGETPLLVACRSGNPQILGYLLMRGADLYALDEKGNTALHGAAANGYDTIIKTLCEEHNLKDKQNKDGNTAFMLAKYHGKEKTADLLYSTLDVNIYDDLFFACKKGDLRKVKRLIADGYTLRRCNCYGETPLMLSMMSQNVELVTYLLQQNADLKTCNMFGDTVLMYASKSGQLHCVKKILMMDSEGGALDRSNNFDITPLMLTGIYGHQDIMCYFLEHHADVNKIDKSGNTVLLLASRNGFDEMVKLLIDKVQKVDHMNHDGNNALMEACYGSHIRAVEVLLPHVENIDKENYQGDTSLIISSKVNSLEIVCQLLERQANINHKNSKGFTPLMVAVCVGSRLVTKQLISNGANVSLRSRCGKTCEQLAEDYGNLYIYLDDEDEDSLYEQINPNMMIDAHLESLYDDCTHQEENESRDGVCQPLPNSYLLLDACETGNVIELNQLLSCGCDINVRDEMGNAPLLVACKKGFKDITTLLMKEGANVNICDQSGKTPLLIACEMGYFEIAEKLLEYKADVNAVDNIGYTCLMLALDGEVELIKLLLSNGVNVNVTNKFGNTALIFAKMKKRYDIVELLQPYNHANEQAFKACTTGNIILLLEVIDIVDLRVKDSKSNTLLMKACLEGQHHIVRSLLIRGAEPNIRNRMKETALMLACRSGHIAIVTTLIVNKAHINLQNERGETELYIACQEGQTEIVRVLLELGALPLCKVFPQSQLQEKMGTKK